MKIFVSYASEDDDVAAHVSTALRQEGYHVFFSGQNLKPGSAVHREISSEIDSTDLVVFLMSEHSIKRGNYTLSELRLALEKWPDPTDRVLPVLVGRFDESDVPPELRSVAWLEARGNLVAEVTAAVRAIDSHRIETDLAATERVTYPTSKQVSLRASRLRVLLSGARVLLVNDSRKKWEKLEELLVRRGVAVTFVATTDDAKSELQSRHFDAIVSDIERGANKRAGIELLEWVRQRSRSVPLVFTVTNYQAKKGTPAYAFGIGTNIDDLLNYLLDILERVRYDQLLPGQADR